jgi:putative nucleotidyltransferase with HDIG domain
VGLALALLTFALFPSLPAADTPVYDVGSVAPEDVVAPFAFHVPKAAAELAAERAEAVRSVPPVFVRRPEGLDTARARLAALERATVLAAAAAARAAPEVPVAEGVRLSPFEAALVRQPDGARPVFAAVGRAFERWLPRGVAANGDLSDVRGEVALDTSARVGRARPDQLVLADADSLLTFTTLLARAERPAADGAAASLFVKVLSASFAPTLAYDRPATARRRAEAEASVDGTRYAVRAGEKIVGGRGVVGREEFEKLRALRDESQARGSAARQFGTRAGRAAGAVLYNFLLVAVLGLTLRLFRPSLYASMRAVGTFAVTCALTLAGAALVARFAPERPELVPAALTAVMLSILFDARIALVAALVVAVLVGGQGPFRGTNALFILLVAGGAGAVSVRTLHRRTQLYKSVLAASAGYALAAAALGLALGWSWSAFAASALSGSACAAASVALAMALLPVAEEAAGVDTYLKLLEWSDLNRPLMQRLSLEAPGTYAHTIAMANLVEAACNAVGANGLLGRVGTYYHDIGKLERPGHFVENQPRGRNPHDKLKPSASAGIIRGHVAEGLKLAAQYKLPRAVRAFITEHHGTNRIVYFLEKARERGDGVVPNPGEYAYPGPLPQSAETAICMLSDGVEAAARVLPDPSPERFRELVDRIVRQRVDEGQLRHAPITLAQLETVKETFVRVLLGMYHSRIDYPAATAAPAAELTRA